MALIMNVDIAIKRGEIMGKIRVGFVTNSSSSSFVIARKNDIKESDVVNLIIDKLSDDIKRELKDIEKDRYIFDYLDAELQIAIIRKDYNEAVKLIANKLCDILLDTYSEMDLGDWKVHSKEFGNEDGFYDCLIYDYGYKLISDNFKVG